MELNWSLCIICQKDTSEPLKCPLHNPVTSSDKKTDVYRSFLENVEQFRDIGALPIELHFGSNESADNLASHSASWHKSCHLKFNNSKLSKAKKREHNTDMPDERRSCKRQAIDIGKCFFCEKGHEEGGLSQVSSFDTDSNMRTMITELQDTNLLCRIGVGDLIAMEAKYHAKCQVNLRNRYRSLIKSKSRDDSQNTNEKVNESRVFV